MSSDSHATITYTSMSSYEVIVNGTSVKPVEHPTQAENLRKDIPKTRVLTRSRLVPLNAAKSVTTAVRQTNVKHQRPVKHVVNKPYSSIRRPINHRPTPKNSNFHQQVTIVKTKKGNPQQTLKDKGVINSGCSRHITGNISYLSDFEETNGGYVAFGRKPKGSKITGKGKIKTGKLDFDDVYFVKELKFHLFSVSQMCDKKNNVLFTDTEYVVSSSDFKLPDENHVLLRVPRENSMYNVDLKNIIPSGDLTCLFAKATLEESNLYHRRLGHINFKIINNLVKVMSSDSHATITYTSMSSYEVIVNGYFGMPMDPLDPNVQLVMEAPPSPDYIPGPEAPPSPDYIPGPEAPPSPEYIPGPEYPKYLPSADDVLPTEEQSLPATVSPTAESPGYITDLEPEMEPEEDDGDNEKSEGDSIKYPTSRGDDDADDDGDDLSEDDADDEDEEESSDSEEEEEEHLAPTVSAPALHSSIPASEDSNEKEPFEEGETAATPPPFGYRVAARIYVQPHIFMPFRLESEVERLLAIPTPPLSPVSPTSYPLLPYLMPLPIFPPLPPPPII
nr:ribonuclease H-like domain-containing protein [Tanacetum cinerariifolium]